ncbi:MAG: hypothetical protein AAGE52_22010 [Myxococcota bacterium]
MARSAIALIMLLWSAPLAAQNDEASQLFRAAVAAHAQGDFAAAARAFEAAHALVPSGAAIYNAAVSWDAGGNRGRAVDAFAWSLSIGGLSDEQRARAEEATADLSAYVVLEVRGRGRVAVEGRASRDAPARFVLAAGAHQVTLGDRREAVLVRESRVLDWHPPPVVEAPEHPAPPPPPTEEGRSAVWGAGWGLVAAGSALGISAAVVGSRALRARDDFVDSAREDRNARDRAKRLRGLTNGLAFGGLAAGLVGIPLIIRGRHRTEVVVTGLGVRAQGAF